MCVETFLLCAQNKCAHKITVRFVTRAHQSESEYCLNWQVRARYLRSTFTFYSNENSSADKTLNLNCRPRWCWRTTCCWPLIPSCQPHSPLLKAGISAMPWNPPLHITLMLFISLTMPFKTFGMAQLRESAISLWNVSVARKPMVDRNWTWEGIEWERCVRWLRSCSRGLHSL